MKILFTGGSSFTGFWFIKELAQAGHEVVATFRGASDQYTGVRKKRVDAILPLCRPVFNCEFGSDSFLESIKKEEHWDLFCHHAADVTNYKSPDFDVVAALQSNTRNAGAVFKLLKAKGCHRILLTGSVFEQNEGAGSENLRAFSPYGLSKGLTSDVFKHHAASEGLQLGKFVIPNPFGPYEEPRFTAYLIKSWKMRQVPAVATPAYVRDNIHVSLLAKSYVHFAESLKETSGFSRNGPLGYAETQGAFTQRFASEMKKRLGLPCEFTLNVQKDFSEPRVRINTDLMDAHALNWDEKQAWDELASYYQQTE